MTMAVPSFHDISEMVKAFGAVIASVATLLVSLGNRKIGKGNKEKIETVHFQLNGRFDEFVDMVKKISHAEGVVDEKARADKEKP